MYARKTFMGVVEICLPLRGTKSQRKKKVKSAFEPETYQRLGILLFPPPSPLDGMLVHRKVTPSIMITGTHLYTWVKSDNVK